MSYRHEAQIAAPAQEVRAAARELFGDAEAFSLDTHAREDVPVRLDLEARDGSTQVVLTTERPEPIPYFQWLVGPQVRRVTRGALAHAAGCLAARVEGSQPPSPPKRSVFSPPVVFGHAEGSVIATASAATVVAGLGSTLFSANVDFITEAFQRTDRAVGIGSAVTRVGVLVALVAAALADRVGRRRMLLASTAGVCVASGLSAVAPTFESFIAFQLVSRGFFNAVFVVSGIIAVEEAPERGRAYALAMVTLAWGAGEALGVAMLPLGDLGSETWRIAYGVNALMLFAIPGFARRLPETTRYRDAAARLVPRGRIRDLTLPSYRARFLLVMASALLLNIMAAPSSQFSNRFLGDERGFSGLEITVFLAVVGGIPGFLGLFVGGRLSETIGRRPVAVWGTAIGTALTVAFYLTSGPPLWLLGTVDTLLVAATVPAVRAFGVELFPTEARGTAAAAIVVTGLLGSAIGLVTVGVLSDHMSLGGAVAWMGIAPLIAALVLLPLLPEPSHKDLDVISPPLG